MALIKPEEELRACCATRVVENGFMYTPARFDYSAFITDLEDLIARGHVIGNSGTTHDSAEFRAWRHELDDLLTRIGRLRYDVNTKFRSRLFRTNGKATFLSDVASFSRDMTDTLSELKLVVVQFKKYGDPKGEEHTRSRTPTTAVLRASPGSADTAIAPLEKEGIEFVEILGKSVRPSEPPQAMQPIDLAEVIKSTGIPEFHHAPQGAEPIKAKPLLPPEKVTWRWIKENVSVQSQLTVAGVVIGVLISAYSFGFAMAGTRAGRDFLSWILPAEPVPAALAQPSQIK